MDGCWLLGYMMQFGGGEAGMRSGRRRNRPCRAVLRLMKSSFNLKQRDVARSTGLE